MTVIKFSDPFYASIAPQLYALATATIISYILVVLIFITPRTFYVGGPGGGANFLGLRSLVPGSGSSSVIGVGRRPLLQKIAAITVAISLTIATADTFRVAARQYDNGFMDSQQLVEDVIGSTEIRVVRVVSDTFLWLAQVQTLIRLFPRHKEKVTIKWLGFALVTCDTVFSILENFVSESTLTRPRSFQDAIPALSYLFQMSISLIYASCVIYYSLSKRRFAFWHSKMKNIFLVAALSLASVLIPVVFFVLDVSQPSIAAWGEYIRWVGAAAASVVVWEWVERIEALERDERKDGILGREIFDGDEMLDMSNDRGNGDAKSTYFGFGRRRSNGGDDDKNVSMFPFANIRPRLPFRREQKEEAEKIEQKSEGRKSHRQRENQAPTNGNITRPPQAVTPISRSDTTSAASTVYAVRYQNVSSPSPAIPEEPRTVEHSRQASVQPSMHLPHVDESGESNQTRTSLQNPSDLPAAEGVETSTHAPNREHQTWTAVGNPFKRKRTEPPAEVAAQMSASNLRRSPAQTYHNLRERFNAFRASQRNGHRKASGPSPPMPVTVIPAQPRTNRLSVPGETPHTSARQSVDNRGVLRERQSISSRRSANSKASRENLPVTVIPAPARGARTWSPDDLRDDGNGSRSSSQRAINTVQAQKEAEHSPPPGSPGNDIVTARGALTITESPNSAKVQGSDARPNSTQSATRFRTPPMDSLDDRISSASPITNGNNARDSENGSRSGRSSGQRRITPKSATASGIQSASSSRNDQPDGDAENASSHQLSPATEAQDTPPPKNIRATHSKI